MLKRIISASLMCANIFNLQKDIEMLEEGGCDWLHFDIMDGIFVPNYTLGPDLMKKIKKHTTLAFDVHLMITEPIRYIDQFVEAGSDIIVVHQEACTHLHRTITKIKDNKIKAGVALNPTTNINTLEDILPELDIVLIMTVNPGFAGQKIIPFTIEKVKKMHKMLKDYNLDEQIYLQVDGNISFENTKKLLKAGANSFVAGTSSLFNGENVLRKTREFRNLIDNFK